MRPTGPPRHPPSRFRLAEWEVLTTDGTLRRGEEVQRLEPKVMEVLQLLMEHPGEVLGKDLILERVWEGAFVEETALARCISEIRQALGDDFRSPRYIETIPKRGYRLIASVEPVEPTSKPSAAGRRPGFPKRNGLITWSGLVTVSLLALLIAIWPNASSERYRLLVIPPDTHTTYGQGSPSDEQLAFAIGWASDLIDGFAPVETARVVPIYSAQTQAAEIRAGGEPEDDVAYYLGSVVEWSSEDDARLSVRLIEIEDLRLGRTREMQVWTEHFEGVLDDTVQVREAIVRRVLAEMGQPVADSETAERDLFVGRDREFASYVTGLGFKEHCDFSRKHLEEARYWFERAAHLQISDDYDPATCEPETVDPQLACAYAELAQTLLRLDLNYVRGDAVRDCASLLIGASQEAAQAALPDQRLLCLDLAIADWSYLARGDFETAAELYRQAKNRFPARPATLDALGHALRKTGQLRQGAEALKNALFLDPENARLAEELAETYRALRDFDNAAYYFDQAVSIATRIDCGPNFHAIGERAVNEFARTGSVPRMAAVLRGSPGTDSPRLAPYWVALSLLAGNPQAALERLAKVDLASTTVFDRHLLATSELTALRILGRDEELEEAARRALDLAESQIARSPELPFHHSYRGLYQAFRGRHEEADRSFEAARSRAQTDHYTKGRFLELEAMGDAVLGRDAAALRKLSQLLGTQYMHSITRAHLQYDPIWSFLSDREGLADLVDRPLEP